MLRLALAAKPPTGFMRNIVVEGSGEAAGDLRHQARRAAADRRSGALRGAQGRHPASTPRSTRLRAAADEGVFEQTTARVLEEAYELFSALRLEHQVAQLEEGSEPDDRLDPKQLDPLTRRYLRDAFREVAAVQRSLAGGLPSRR